MQVHCYESLGQKIILDVPGGAVHLADGLFFELVKLLADGKSEAEARDILLKDGADATALEECFDEVRQLKADGALYTEEGYVPLAEEMAERPTVVKALCLHVAHACNLACRYCFAGEGEYHGERALMSLETGKKALDFLVAQSGNREHLEVDFFGGEPLMNFEVVKELVAYGRAIEEETKDTAHPKVFRFTLTTNGLLLNEEIMDFCDREMDNVVLSIDGRKEVHDAMRPCRDGSGSYDVILDKLLTFAKRRREKHLQYYVRGTYTHHNLDFTEDVLHLADLGFDQISVEPVVAPPTEAYAITEEDVSSLSDAYEALGREMLRRNAAGEGFQFFHYMIDLSGGPCIYKRISGCGAGSEYLAVTPQGELYPCHQFVGNEAFLLGDVERGIVADDLVRAFKKVNVYAKEACRTCFARFYCSGGCAANAHAFAGDVNAVYEIGCQLQRKRIETAIALKAAESTREENEE